MSEEQTLQVVEYHAQRVLTTAQIARAYGTIEQIVTNNFNRNKEKYQEGKHYICLEGEALRAFKKQIATTNQIDLSSTSRLNKLYLWTEKGALLQAKTLNTDRAWEACEHLIDEYFRLVKQQVGSEPPTQSLKDVLRERLLLHLQQKIPAGCFTADSASLNFLPTLADELKKSFLDRDLLARLEQSIAQCFAKYYEAELLSQPGSHRERYTLVLPTRIVHPWAYGMQHFTTFEQWLWNEYIPKKFKEYERRRAKYLGLPLPAQSSRKRLARPVIDQANREMTQLLLFAGPLSTEQEHV